MTIRSALLKFFILFSLASNAADIAQAINGDAQAQAQEAAKVYSKIIKSNACETENFLMTKIISIKNFKEVLNNFKERNEEAGIFIASANIEKSYFLLDDVTLKEYPKGLKKLHQFLLSNGFFQPIGHISTNKLLEKNQTFNKVVQAFRRQIETTFEIAGNKELEAVHKSNGTTSSPPESINVLLLSQTRKYLYHKILTGVLFRDGTIPVKDKVSSDYSEFPEYIKILFTKNNELSNLLTRAHGINNKLVGEINQLKTVFEQHFKDGQQSADDARSAFDALLAHPNIPDVLERRLERSRNLPNVVGEATRLDEILKDHLGIATARRDSMAAIVPAPIDIFLLYCMYLFEESKSELLVDKYFPVIESYTDRDELSTSNLLAEPALQVMEQFGFDFDDETIEEAPEQRNRTNKKSSSSRTKRANKSQNKKPPKKAAPKTPKELPRVDSDEEDDGDLLDSAANPKTAEASSSAESKKAPTIKRKIIVRSLNDCAHGQPISLEITRGHRMLDRLARLLAFELSLDIEYSAGSISLALVPREDKLIIATKANRANANLFNALLSIAEKAQAESTNHIQEEIKGRKEEFNQIWQTINQDERHPGVAVLLKRGRKVRNVIDNKKLAVMMHEKNHGDFIQKSLSKVLLALKAEHVIILDNPSNLHSELVLAEYLRITKKYLGSINTDLGVVTYQYMAGSLLNCAKCDALLRGENNIHGLNRAPTLEMALFSRGSYKVLYPGYVVPQHSCLINKMDRRQMTKWLNKIQGEDGTTIPYVRKVRMQQMSLSESEGDSERRVQD